MHRREFSRSELTFTAHLARHTEGVASRFVVHHEDFNVRDSGTHRVGAQRSVSRGAGRAGGTRTARVAHKALIKRATAVGLCEARIVARKIGAAPGALHACIRDVHAFVGTTQCRRTGCLPCIRRIVTRVSRHPWRARFADIRAVHAFIHGTLALSRCPRRVVACVVGPSPRARHTRIVFVNAVVRRAYSAHGNAVVGIVAR
mmetsp:Transcript_8518/g.31890  ORF Transcript_8518/g.31890 Transcript_8518/m.31890 type:complete len:202 (-) Transcript_8518:261-866(-)